MAIVCTFQEQLIVTEVPASNIINVYQGCNKTKLDSQDHLLDPSAVLSCSSELGFKL